MRAALRLIVGGSGLPDGTFANAGTMAKLSQTVLVVEDDVLVRLAIAAHLRDVGYRVVEAVTAEEARAAMSGGEPVMLIFTDINLAGKWQGTDLAAWVHAEFPAVKVIMTSSAFHSVAGLSACDRFIPKPYQPQEVAEQVKNLVGA